MSNAPEKTQVPIRDCFKHEERDFTPWLAQNIQLLCTTVGLDLEVEQTEKACGPYSADIVAKDVRSGRYVIIENQFGKTNHDHLGKLLTYAAYHDAAVIIWISERFTAEHMKAVNWLQQRTNNEMALYAVTVEAFASNNSSPHIQFKQLHASDIPALSRNQAIPIRKLSKPPSRGRENALSADSQLRFEFWTQLREKLIAEKIVADAQPASPVHYFDIRLGRAGFSLSNIISTRERRMNVRLYLQKQIADLAIQQLARHKTEIETAVGEVLTWNPHPGDANKSIGLQREANISDQSQWPEYLEWMSCRIARFVEVFAPRIQQMDFSHPPFGNGFGG